jgi:hypothetical protein
MVTSKEKYLIIEKIKQYKRCEIEGKTEAAKQMSNYCQQQLWHIVLNC